VKADRKAIEKQLDANVKGVVEKLNRVEPGHCKDCKHFNERAPGEGPCKLTEVSGGAPVHATLAHASGDDHGLGWLWVKAEFGCIQFEPKGPQ
jgi:hypothetical protein